MESLSVYHNMATQITPLVVCAEKWHHFEVCANVAGVMGVCNG